MLRHIHSSNFFHLGQNRLPQSWVGMDLSQSPSSSLTTLSISQSSILISKMDKLLTRPHKLLGQQFQQCTLPALNHLQPSITVTVTAEGAVAYKTGLDGSSKSPLRRNTLILTWLQNVMKLMQCYPPPKTKVKALRAEAALHNELPSGGTHRAT